VTGNMTGPQQTRNGTNQPQLNALNDATTLVTVGIGGNDTGFIAYPQLNRGFVRVHRRNFGLTRPPAGAVGGSAGDGCGQPTPA
jgi:hypothetical protein